MHMKREGSQVTLALSSLNHKQVNKFFILQQSPNSLIVCRQYEKKNFKKSYDQNRKWGGKALSIRSVLVFSKRNGRKVVRDLTQTGRRAMRTSLIHRPPKICYYIGN